MKKYFDLKKIEWGLWFIIFFFAFIYSFIAITKHNHFQTGLDFGIYVQTFWNYINLQLPRVTLYPTYGDIVWADHFTPTLIFLAPFYFLWRDPKMLLILQSVLFVLGAYPIFRFAKESLKSNFFAYSLVLGYLLFFGTQYALTFDFHAATYSAIFLPWLFWFLFKKKWKLFTLSFFLALGAKEDMSLLLFSISFYLIISRYHRKLGVVLALFSLGYFLIVTKYIMPGLSVLSAKVYDTPTMPRNILGWVLVLFDSPVKIRTMFLAFLSFAFLPLFSGWFATVPITHFFINFFSSQFAGRWDIYLHYRVHLAAILSFAAILGIKFISHNRGGYFLKTLAVLLLGVTIFLDYYLHLPLNTLLKRNFYQTESWMEDNFAVMRMIPNNAYLLTQNNLAPHVGNRQYLYYYPRNLAKADYIFLDLRPHQPIINFWLSGTQKIVEKEVKKLIDTGMFKVEYQKGEAILLKRNK